MLPAESSFIRVPSPELEIQRCDPSTATPLGAVPTAKVPRIAPSIGPTFMTLFDPELATQRLVPSKAIPVGPLPTGKGPKTRLSLARISERDASKKFVV